MTGFEWAVGVPGSVGGAVRMNAGGHGSDMAAALIDVDVFDLDDVFDRGSISIHRPTGCGHERDVSRRATSACASAGPT